MILRKFAYFTKAYKSTTIIIRKYAKRPYIPLTMPKDKQYIMELQKQRRRIKSQTVKYSPSTIYFQVIGNGTPGEFRSIALATDHTNYLFNCGEGTQRLAAEHHVRLTKAEHIFITRPTWENIGGIPGVALTIQDTGLPKINLHGPEGTIDIIEAIDSFVTLNELTVDEGDSSTQFSDQTMTLTYVPINCPKEPEKDEFTNTQFHIDNINFYDYQLNPNGKRTRSPNSSKPQPIRKSSTAPKGRINSMMIYVGKIHPRAGTLDFEKCVDAGVTPGPNLGKLKAGEDVTLPDGRIVRSVDVVSPPEAGPLFIVLECPNTDWIDVIVENPVFLKYQQKTATNKDEVASYVVHFTPENILNHPKYKEWMHKFGSGTKHLIINEENTGFSSEAMHKMQHQLHLVHPDIFPFLNNRQCFADLNKSPIYKLRDQIDGILKDSEESQNTELVANKNIQSDNSLVKDEPFIHRCKTQNLIHLRPPKGIENVVVDINPKEYVDDVFAIDGFLDILADLQTNVNAKMKELGNTEEYPKLLFLGTGSSIPNKVRNTSGMLLQLDEERSIILDCGEATIGQIIRFYGETEANRILKTIKAIYVSHLHADHHLGLIGILKQREKVSDEPIFLLAPQQISSYLHFYHNRFEPILKQIRLVSNRDLLQNQTVLLPSTLTELYERLQISNISTTFVTHCPFAYGVAITLKDGRKICYSGDAMPCDNMRNLAKDCFLLIHEATMEDNLKAEALIKRHSTISQAVDLGIKANASFTLLTHFSQRYSKMPMLPDKDKINLGQVGIAFDFMQISLSQLTLLPLFFPTFELMFSEFRALLDERAIKREARKELVNKVVI